MPTRYGTQIDVESCSWNPQETSYGIAECGNRPKCRFRDKRRRDSSTRGTQVRSATETEREGRGSESIEEITKTVVGVGHRRGHPAVLSQHRGIGQGDATGVSPGSTSVELGRASRKMMHEGAVRVMAELAGGRTLPVTRGTASGGVVMSPAGKTPKTKGRRKGVHWVFDREEVVRESVNEHAMQVRNHGREPVTKGTVKTRTDFSGEPPVER